MNDGFTDDVIALLQCGPKGRLPKILAEADGPIEDFIRSGLIASLSDSMLKTPAFVQQVVGRALMECVDWKRVAQWSVKESN